MVKGRIIRERFICTDPSFTKERLSELIEDPLDFCALTLHRKKERPPKYYLGIHIKEIFERREPVHIEIELQYNSEMNRVEVNRVKRKITDYINDRILRKY